MKTFRKYLLIILALIIFNLTFLPTSALEEPTVIDIENFAQLNTELTNTKSGFNFRIISDITIPSTITLKATSAITGIVDLNGHTLTFKPSSSSYTSAISTDTNWHITYINSLETGGFISTGSNFFSASNNISFKGIFETDITSNANIYFNDVLIKGKVTSRQIFINSGKTAVIHGSLSTSNLQMVDSTSALKVFGRAVCSRYAIIRELAVFESEVVIGKDYVHNSGDGTTTRIYGGVFKGKLSISENVNLRYSTASYRTFIYSGRFYDELNMGYAHTNNLGTLSVNVYGGYFHKNAVINCPITSISGGHFTYTFNDDQGNELKSLMVRFGAQIIPPKAPIKDGLNFAGWTNFNFGMSNKNNNTFYATYDENISADDNGRDLVLEYNKAGVAIEGAYDIVTDVVFENTDFNKDTGVTSTSSSIYGLSDYIPVQSGDIFKINAVKTNVYNGEAFAAAYDQDKKFLGSFVHNEHTKLSFIGRRTKYYSIGVVSSKTYEQDVTFQIPSTEERSIFKNIAYIRAKAFKNTTDTQLITKDDFYLAYMGNTDPTVLTKVNYLRTEENPYLNNALYKHMGDINYDNHINVLDSLILTHALSRNQGYSVGLANADVNYDGKVNLKDFAYQRRYMNNVENYPITQKKFIALSFDDTPGSMSEVLNIFEEYKSQNVRATFFLNGSRVNEGNYSLLKRANNLNLDLANHSTFHEVLTSISRTEILQDINFTQDIIYNQTGQTNYFFRAPYFSTSAWMGEVLSEMVFIEGTGSSDTTTTVTAEQSAASQLNQAKDGNIILLHDNGKLAPTLRILIPSLLEQGYALVTVDELFKYHNVTPKPGYVYTNVLATPKKVG